MCVCEHGSSYACLFQAPVHSLCNQGVVTAMRLKRATGAAAEAKQQADIRAEEEVGA
jgi:hypothetical protein